MTHKQLTTYKDVVLPPHALFMASHKGEPNDVFFLFLSLYYLLRCAFSSLLASLPSLALSIHCYLLFISIRFFHGTFNYLFLFVCSVFHTF